MSMQYVKSVEDFFKHPKWGMNSLLGGVCMFIPLIGQIVLSGWVISQLWAQGDEEDPAKFPEFDFNHFVKYLGRGVWPFLVQLVTGLAIGLLVAMLVILVIVALAGLAAAVGEAAAIAFPLMFLIGMVAYAVLIIGINFLLIPLSLKATLTQDFGAAFDLGFVTSFLSNVWKETIISALFMLALGIGLMIATLITLGIGMYFLMPVATFAWQHLMKQLYGLHLERGGTPVTKSSKLNDLPPALPEAAI